MSPRILTGVLALALAAALGVGAALRAWRQDEPSRPILWDSACPEDPLAYGCS